VSDLDDVAGDQHAYIRNLDGPQQVPADPVEAAALGQPRRDARSEPAQAGLGAREGVQQRAEHDEHQRCDEEPALHSSGPKAKWMRQLSPPSVSGHATSRRSMPSGVR
jgi:hypothetical protein